jgi:hypothetical protein
MKVEVVVEEALVMFAVLLLQVEDAVIKAVDTKDHDDVVLDINVVAIMMPITTARMLLSMMLVVITVMHIHGKYAMAILMDQIIGQDFSLDRKVPQAVVMEIVEDSNLEVEMEVVVMTLTRMTPLLMRHIQLPLAHYPLSQITFLLYQWDDIGKLILVNVGCHLTIRILLMPTIIGLILSEQLRKNDAQATRFYLLC